MRFIGEHPRTQEQLRAWVGKKKRKEEEKKLIFGQFYFLAAGTDSESQRTLLGMLKSLLFQVLSQCPGLNERVSSGQLGKMKMSRFQGNPSVQRFQDFGSMQIEAAFDLLLNYTVDAEHRICFLIAGLDESGGDDSKFEDLAARLKAWTTRRNIKLLVSSRPWSPFLTIFTAHPTLHLHKLNRFEIRTYVIRQLKQDR